MSLERERACAARARDAGFLPTAAFAAVLLACAGAGAQTPSAGGAGTPAQAGAKPAAADFVPLVGAWQARLPTGLLAGMLVLVPEGERLGGAFVGYDYAGPLDMEKPVEGPPPAISMRTGSLVQDAKLEGDTLIFKMFLRHPSPPPGRPGGFEVTCAVKFQGGDKAELRLSAPQQPEPLLLRLTRE